MASRNRGKIAEMKRLFEENGIDLDVLSLDDIGFEGDIVEDGGTFEENALIKARVPASLGYIGVADDSGLCVDALDGAPGIYSARFSGDDHTDEKNRKLLLEKLSDVEDDKRGANFVCVIAAVFPEPFGLDPIICRGECHGRIAHEVRGTGGFGYDSLFSYGEGLITFAEMTENEKGAVSHRGAAMKMFAKRLTKIAPQVDKRTV